ncbi:HlyD family type I secretion periplasmic adaptor subunit [Sphingomonas sp. LB-2]|uniref:HlyD family type I secretion periplasmic adaptor subunit n=1 Tax=Sphingomonas caeni TaxID=2984949 RepID=UPI00222FBA4C|nr:HlyD family type I secretion periplasmic adaptor subunit [Sphingomonas caeni]MCW3847965.1 HlyD family type I secretion periplasmic adaptor subunit [Sphingomonas caeni]
MSFATRFPTLTRHWQVLRESWAAQNKAVKAQRPRTDHEFLPAALEIMETPPSPGLRWLLLVLCALFAVAILWSVFAHVDVVAVARGKVIPAANVKLIQPIEIGAVRAIHVRNGQHVDKGELLIELDPTVAGAEEAQATQGLASADLMKARTNAILGYLAGGPIRFTVPPGIPPAIADVQRRYVTAAIAEFEAQRASLLQQRAERAAELASSLAEIAKLRETLPLVEQQLAARRVLADRGYFSKLRLLEYEQARIEHLRNIDVQEANASKARAAIATLDAEIVKLRDTFAKTAVSDLGEATDKSGLATEELRKTQHRREFQAIRAPVSGTVQQLAVATVGGVVQPAQVLMVIVPDDSAVEVEAEILNKDIGFVREGQPVRVKLDAYPFTDFGLIDGTVETISRDAIQQSPQQTAAEHGQTPQPGQGLVYAARIRLNRRTIRIAGHDQLIGPGLAVQVEIKTGERRVIQYLLSPIATTVDEAGRER